MNSKPLGDDFLDGKHSGHTPADQIDSQHRADYEGHANGGCVQDAQGTATGAVWPAVCRVDE